MVSDSTHIDQIAREIMADISLREKAAIAQLDEEDLPCLQHAFDLCVSDKPGYDNELGKDVIYRMWKVLQGVHRVSFLSSLFSN